MDRLPPNMMLAILVFAAVACAVIVLAVLWEWWGDRRRQRDLARRLAGVEPGDEGKGADPFGDLFKEGARLVRKQRQAVLPAR